MEGARAGLFVDEAIGPVPTPGGSWVNRHRYAALSAVVLVLTVVQTLNGQWSSDMWEHVAVVRELIARPFDPQHPQLLTDAPHPGFSPYSVVLGMVGNGLGVSALTVLSWAAVVNVGLLLAALGALVREVTGNARAAFWALLFVLLLWGVGPYRYSGFFGLNSIGFVAPYPSTFATAVAFATLLAAIRFGRGAGWWCLAVVAVGAAVVLLVHPLTAPWLGVALVLVAALHVRPLPRLVGFAASGLAALVLSIAWPYFSVLDLVRDSGDLEGLNQSMYSGVLLKVFPLLLGLVAVVRRWRADHHDLLTAWLVGALALYALGAALDNTSLGRSLAFVVVLLAVALADWVGRLEATTDLRAGPPEVRLAAAALGALLVLGVVTGRGGLVRMVPEPLLPSSVRESRELVRPNERFAFLRDHVGPTDVVLAATKADNRVVPAVAGRTVTLAAPRPFLDDLPERDRAQREVLDPDTPEGRRTELLDRYHVRFVLLHPRDPGQQALVASLQGEGGTVVASERGLVLLLR